VKNATRKTKSNRVSVFSDIGSFFSGAVSTVVDAAKDAWNAIRTVWAFLVQAARIVDEAWTWVVNGVEWFTSKVEDWAAEVYNGISHILFTVIPNAIKWAIEQAVGWAARAVRDVDRWAKARFSEVTSWAKRELNRIENLAKGWFDAVVKWVKHPIEWVIKEGEKIVELLFHPEALAKWVLGGLLVPLVTWLLRQAVTILSYLLRIWVDDSSEIASILEDFIHKVV
jgi:hypothetical protein